MTDSDTIYLVLRQSRDCDPRMVEIKGIFAQRADADRFREEVFEIIGEHTQVQAFRVQA